MKAGVEACCGLLAALAGFREGYERGRFMGAHMGVYGVIGGTPSGLLEGLSTVPKRFLEDS